MFSSFISALQGDDANDSGDEGGPPLPDKEAGSEQEAAGSSDWASNLTGFASGFAKSMKLKTAEIASSVSKTDWRSELTAFTSEVQKDARTVQKEAVHAVEHFPETAQGVWSKPPQPPAALAGPQLDEVRRFGQSLLQGTSEIFAEVSKSVTSEIEKAGKSKREPRARAGRNAVAAVNGKYSRFETEVSAIQRDSSTYCDEPEDLEDYAKFNSTFSLSEKKGEIDSLLQTNAFMSELQTRIVPLIVEYDVFWTRYYYRLFKLQEKHSKRQALALRAQEQEQEEDIGWGDDDDEAISPAAETLQVGALSPADDTLWEEAENGVQEQSPLAIHVEEVPQSPASDTKNNPTEDAQQQLDMQEPLVAGDEEAAVSVSSSTVKVSTCKSDGDPSTTSETASGDWYVMPASPASGSPNHTDIGASIKDKGYAEEEAPISSSERPPSPTGKVRGAARENTSEKLSDQDEASEAGGGNPTGPGPSKAADAPAEDDDDEDDLDEDWGAS